jgi:hypothetical protein
MWTLTQIAWFSRVLQTWIKLWHVNKEMALGFMRV